MASAPATKSVAYQRAIRSPNALRPENIPYAANRVEQLGFERAVDLLAQAADEDVDDVGLRVEVVLPHVRQDHRFRDDDAGMAHQVLEEGELARTQVDRLAGARHLARQQIEHEVFDGQRGGFRRAR